MPDLKVLLITANTVLSKAITSAFTSMYIQSAVLTNCSKLLLQDKPKYTLVLLDLDSLGAAKIAELKAFLARISGLPVIAMCNMGKTSNSEIVEILSIGVNDVMPNAMDMNVLVAKTKSHLRRLGVNSAATERAAENLNHQ